MIAVFGLLGEPSQALIDAAANADVVVGARRHLDLLGVEERRRITMGALRVACDKILQLPADRTVVVVASGDPDFFGVVRSLRARRVRCRVHPAPSSIAAAFGAVGLPWDDAVVVSVHGRPLEPAINLARAFPKVAMLTSADHGIGEIAAGVADLGRWFVLAERLGEPDEKVRILDADAARTTVPVEPNVVLVLAEHPDAGDSTWQGRIAGPERSVPPRRHESGSARPDLRAAAAVAFATLLPQPGDLLLVGGPLADQITPLARWAGAAVVGPGPLSPGCVPTLACTDVAGAAGAGAAAARTVVVLDADPAALPGAFAWADEQVGPHHLWIGEPR